jgi:hypothetical protein
MKYLSLLLFCVYTHGSLDELDLTLPEQPSVHIPPKEIFLNLGDYYEPPTKEQLIIFWTLNVLDVYTTHEGMRNCSRCREQNFLLPARPTLEELLLQKAIVGGFMAKNSSKKYVRFLNVSLTLATINNYRYIK